MKTIPAELLDAMREIVRRALMTLAAVRDPDHRFLGYARQAGNIVHEVKEAYGYSSASVRNFAPTAYEISQMEVVLPWLAWLRRQEGEQAIRRIIAWSMGSALWRIGQRESCSERTVTNRIDRSISAIIQQFTGANIPVERVEEPYKGATYALVYERLSGPHGECVIQKVYIGGLGFMKGHKKVGAATDHHRLDKIAI